jgi:hypothetical protein
MDDSTRADTELELPASRISQVAARQEKGDRHPGFGLPEDMVSPP